MFCSSFCSLKQGKQFGFQPSACFTVKINTKISQTEFRLKGTPLTCLLLWEPRSSCFAQVVPLAAAQYIVQLCPRAKAITGLGDKSSYSEIWQGGYFWHLVSSGSQDEAWGFNTKLPGLHHSEPISDTSSTVNHFIVEHSHPWRWGDPWSKLKS